MEEARGLSVSQLKAMVQKNLESLAKQSKWANIHLNASEVILERVGATIGLVLGLEHAIVRGEKNYHAEVVAYLEEAMAR